MWWELINFDDDCNNDVIHNSSLTWSVSEYVNSFDCPVLQKSFTWYLPNIEKHVIFGSEIPIRVGIVVLSWISVEFTQSQRGIDSSHPLFKWILILKETKNGFNIINRRSNDCDVPEIIIMVLCGEGEMKLE